MLGGDVAGKGLVPVLADNGHLTAEVRGEQVGFPPPRGNASTRRSTRSASTRCGWTPTSLARLRDDPAEGGPIVFRAEIVAQVGPLV